MSFAWNALQKDFAGVALPIAVAAFVMVLPSTILNFARGFALGIIGGTGGADADTINLINIATTPILYIVNILVQAFIMGGIVRFALAIVRGKKPEFGEVFSGGSTFGPFFVGQLLLSIGCSIGFVLCIVPGVILGLGCQFYAQEIVDKNQSGVDALKKSWELTTGHKMNLLVLGLILFGIVLLGLAACCVGALVVATPIAVISSCYVYLKLTGEEPVMIS